VRTGLVPVLAEPAFLRQRDDVVLGKLRVARVFLSRGARTSLVSESRSGNHQYRHHSNRQSVDDLALHANLLTPFPHLRVNTQRSRARIVVTKAGRDTLEEDTPARSVFFSRTLSGS
jgi:hypothetical protein